MLGPIRLCAEPGYGAGAGVSNQDPVRWLDQWWLHGKKLANCFSRTTAGWIGARSIINPDSLGDLIGANAKANHAAISDTL
jgi:hypothetical protein